MFNKKGRVKDMLQTSDEFAEYIKNVEFLVLDECDKLLFNETLFVDVEVIMSFLKEERQVILTSATI